MRPPRALPAAHFDRNERYAYFGDRTLEAAALLDEDKASFLPLERRGA